MESAFQAAKPPFFNVTEFFTVESQQIVQKEEISRRTKALNAEILQQLEEEENENFRPNWGKVPKMVG